MRDRGSLFALCGAFLIAVPAIADDKPATETVIRLTVDAAATPKPALKYQLLPEMREMQPGNAVPAFYKCVMEQQNLYYNQKVVEEREKFLDCPLSELKGKNLKTYGGSSSLHADYAARLDTVDWQLLNKLRIDGIGLLIPDVQVLRGVAAVLKVRFRAQVAEGDFEAAANSAKTLLSMARCLGQHSTLIGNLVGIAVSMIAVGPIEEMIGQPGCPNLYWALTYLPSPLLESRNSWLGERIWLFAEFPGLFDDPSAKSEDQLAKYVARFKYIIKESGGEPAKQKDALEGEEDVEAWVEKRSKDGAYVEGARKRVIDAGWAEAAVKRMPPVQIVLVDQFVKFQGVQDEIYKWLNLPLWQAAPGIQKVNLKEAGTFALFLSATLKVKNAQTRLEQRIALLRHVEAIRLYAAANGGKLPASLDKIEVPLTVDPVSGKAFSYSVKDGTATIHGSTPEGMEKSPAWNVRYEITIRR